MTYRIFTKEFDETRDVTEVMGDIEDGYTQNVWSFLDGMKADTSALTFSCEGPAPVFLLDCSGSMRGRGIMNAVFALRAAGDALHEAGRPFEILGFTTRAWKGGESRKAWLDAGRPQQPGRLNDRLHLLVKHMDQPWPEARKNLSYLLKEGLLKENIDGEALAWARERIQGREGDQVLIPISDGMPVDDSTLSVNPMRLLEDHMRAEQEALFHAGIRVQGVFIGKDLPRSGILPDPVHVSQIDHTQGMVDGMAETFARISEREAAVEGLEA